ncbi:MAG: ferritin-like domain-containing protein [bacterium]
MSGFKPEFEVLNIALAAEGESLKRYLHFAWETDDFTGKNMFIRLAMDELMHQELIKRVFDQYLTRGECLPVEVPPSIIEQLIPKISEKNLLIKGKQGQSALEALLTAQELENKARRFYTEQAEKAEPEPLRALFRRLAEMEQAHLELIQAEIDSIQQTGFWLGFQEFTLEANP